MTHLHRLETACAAIPRRGTHAMTTGICDDWLVRYIVDELGNHFISASRAKNNRARNIGFDVTDGVWPLYRHNTPADADVLADLVERADWDREIPA